MILKCKNQLLLAVSCFCMLVMTVNCTGSNLGRIYGLSTTNPTPDYSNPYFPLIRGGGLYHNNTIPGQLGLNAEGKAAIGEACSYAVLYLVGWGDSSIEEAKKAGKITRVASIEYEQTGILGFFYHSFCTIATGTSDSSGKSVEDAKAASEPAPAKKPAKKGK